MHVLLFLSKDSKNPSIWQKTKHIQFSSKDPMYPCLTQKTMDIQSKSKDEIYPSDKTQWISNYGTINHNFVMKLNWNERALIKQHNGYELNIKTCKTSSTLVEDLASNHNEIKAYKINDDWKAKQWKTESF